MPDYRRYPTAGGTYFFTVNLFERSATDLSVRHVDVLRHAVWETSQRQPFNIGAWVVLPTRRLRFVPHLILQEQPITAFYKAEFHQV
jgi:hypothetical protein